MIKAGIIGTGNIGTDLLLKILKTDFMTPVIFAGRRMESDGIRVALEKGIPVTDKGIQYFIDNPNCCDVVYDCTSAADAFEHAQIFASQGIKLSQEALQTDKLGKQLKSFTEWLKTMKKVHPEKVVAIAEQTELLVQNLAEKSNIEDDVLTEAMAEVFAMQGKNNKAIEVYEKLSLLNPLKSAYFAAKILPLKG